MVAIAEKIIDMLQSGNILWLAVLLIVAFVMNASKIFDFFEGRKKKQIRRLQEAVACELLDENFRNFVSHEIQREYFLYVANIAGEKRYRDKLFEIHRQSNGRLPFFHIRRASGFLKYDNNNVEVRIGWFDKVSYWVNVCGAIFFLFIGWAFFMMPILIKPLTVVQALVFVGVGLDFLFAAMLFGSQTFPFSSAIKVRSELEEQKK